MNDSLKLVFTTKNEVNIYVEKGKKKESKFDYKVKYKEPNKRLRTPKYIHLITDLYSKYYSNKKLTIGLKKHIIEVADKISGVDSFPPQLQVFDGSKIKPFESLNNVGYYSVEFILVVIELLMIQEKTNYPGGYLTWQLLNAFLEKDPFTVIGLATHRWR